MLINCITTSFPYILHTDKSVIVYDVVDLFALPLLPHLVVVTSSIAIA